MFKEDEEARAICSIKRLLSLDPTAFPHVMRERVQAFKTTGLQRVEELAGQLFEAGTALLKEREEREAGVFEEAKAATPSPRRTRLSQAAEAEPRQNIPDEPALGPSENGAP